MHNGVSTEGASALPVSVAVVMLCCRVLGEKWCGQSVRHHPNSSSRGSAEVQVSNSTILVADDSLGTFVVGVAT